MGIVFNAARIYIAVIVAVVLLHNYNCGESEFTSIPQQLRMKI